MPDLPQMLGMIYVSLAPVIFAGILNMGWVRSKAGRRLNVPMDGGRRWADGRRLFGDHKTWKGFFGMIGLGLCMGVLWGALLKGRALEDLDLFYRLRANTPGYSALTGALSGLAYALAELPNSFLKRRLDIRPGKTAGGAWQGLFIFLDQADSVIGCLLLLRLFYPFGAGLFVLGTLAGALTHLFLNMLLYFLRLRDNMF